MSGTPHGAPVRAGQPANIGRLLTESARNFPDRVAVRYEDVAQTYRELNTRVDGLAIGLEQLGLRTGDRVVVWLANCPQYLEVLFACWKLGLTAVPINARLTAEEVSYHVHDCQASLLVYDIDFHEQASEVTVTHRICVGGAADTLEQLIATNVHDCTVDVNEDHPAWLFYTSGTTGRPKAATLTHRNLLYVVLAWCADLHQIQPEDVALHCAPLSHGAGFLALAAVARGAENLIHRKWGAARFCSDVAKYGVTCTWLVPTQIRVLLDADELATAQLDTLACIVYGGSPIHREDLDEALDRLGPILCQIYGQGESPMTITYLRREDHAVARGDDVLQSAGRCRTGIEVRVTDGAGMPLAAGEVGEIAVRGSSVMSGYWQRPQATAEALRDGWLYTGDLGRLDARGYLYVLDRKKDFIISGGSNVYAREVEDVILQHPAIHEVAVFGVPDRLWGEAVTAAVVGPSVDPDEVLEFLRPRLADYKRPKRVLVYDALPKNAYGKVLKRELRAAYGTSSIDTEVLGAPTDGKEIRQ